MRAWATPPQWLRITSWAIVVVGAVLVLLGAYRIGVTVDEVYHVDRLQNFMDRGWYLLDDDFRGESPGSWVSNIYVYGPASTLFLHVLNVIVGNETWGEVAFTEQAYAVRHVGVAIIGLVGLAATAVMAGMLARSRSWGVVGAAVLVCLPMWTGHAMFNMKDIPVATGYTLVTAACVALVSRPRLGRVAWSASVLALVVGIYLAVGTRPAIWPGLVSGLAVATTALLLGRARPRPWLRVAVLWGAAGAALVCLAALYPQVFADPARWVLGSVGESGGYEGNRVWGYIPAAVLVTVPTLMLALGTSGLIGRARAWMTLSRGRLDPAMVLVLFQALLLPALLTLKPAAMHEGLRHVLFAAPAVAVLLVAGFEQLLRDVVRPAARSVVAVLVVAGLCSPLLAQVQSFPYGYGYSNEFADALGVGIDADLWQASFREYAGDIAPDDFVVCGPQVRPDGRPVRAKTRGGPWSELSEDCATGNTVLAPFVTPRTPNAGAAVGPVSSDFVALAHRTDPPPSGCEELARVTRWRLFSNQVMSIAYRCPLVLPAYQRPIELAGDGAGEDYLLGGWSGLTGDRGMTVAVRANLGFDVGVMPTTLVLDVTGSGDARFLVNNEPVRTNRTGSGWRLEVVSPPPPIGASAGNIVLTVVARTNGSRVTTVTVAP